MNYYVLIEKKIKLNLDVSFADVADTICSRQMARANATFPPDKRNIRPTSILNFLLLRKDHEHSYSQFVRWFSIVDHSINPQAHLQHQSPAFICKGFRHVVIGIHEKDIW